MDSRTPSWMIEFEGQVPVKTNDLNVRRGTVRLKIMANVLANTVFKFTRLKKYLNENDRQ